MIDARLEIRRGAFPVQAEFATDARAGSSREPTVMNSSPPEISSYTDFSGDRSSRSWST